MKALKTRQHYSHCGEYFSKILMLRETSTEAGGLIHVYKGESEYKKYNNVARELGLDYYKLTSLHDLFYCKNVTGIIYGISVDELSQEISESSTQKSIHLESQKYYNTQQLGKDLSDKGYEFHEFGKPGSYMSSGDTMKIIFPSGQSLTVSFWGDEIESITDNDGVIHQNYSLYTIEAFTPEVKNNISLISFIQEQGILCVLDSLQFHHSYENIITSQARWISLNILSNLGEDQPSLNLGIESLSIENLEDLKSLLGSHTTRCKIFTRHEKTISEFLKVNNFKHISTTSVSTHLLTSFKVQQKSVTNVYICDDILGKIFIKSRAKKKLSTEIDLLLKIQNGDYIVHIDHGIGIFKGLIKKQLGEIEKEYLEISYKQNDTLFVPITQVHRVSKYIGSENPELTPLSGKVWERKIQKVHEDIREIAEGILENFAQRKLRSGNANIINSKLLEGFRSDFPYSYTPDQETAISEIFQDMQSDKNMDRLLVGDVGFGKTEVAFNAAFVALSNKKQVLLISPLVVLAHEHYDKTLERFLNLPYNIEVLSRLQSQKHATQVLKGLADGSVDMVVGTHRLLSDKLVCKNLGLMIVDEEHKFGVSDKEKIKNIKSDIDILSLSATPIPRSLNLALSGVRNISLLKTPPGGRKSIQTSVLRFNEKLIQDAGKREFERNGQIFFVHNRVTTIEVMKKKIESLFPKKKVVITHGQLPGEQLENRILDFKNKKYDILLSTTVIENGIDFSNVNTIFINECQQFGISQIHQLRGRVGRSDTQGYCYLLYKRDKLDGEAAKRIQTIVDYSYLGAGFELAMKDLEIRGGGDILGLRQSGQAKEIGVSLFLKMLEEKITELKEQKQSPNPGEIKQEIKIHTKIDLMVSAGIPDSYFLNETDKINFYREIELVTSHSDLGELKDSFFENNKDEIPSQSQMLFELLECQIYCKKYMIQTIKKSGMNYAIEFDSRTDIQTLKSFLTLDSEVKFTVVDGHHLRSPTKGFENDGIFIKYLLRLFSGNIANPKFKLVKKHIN